MSYIIFNETAALGVEIVVWTMVKLQINYQHILNICALYNLSNLIQIDSSWFLSNKGNVLKATNIYTQWTQTWSERYFHTN